MIDYEYGVTLRPIQFRNLEVMRLARNSPQIRNWTRQSDLITEEQQKEWYMDKYTKDPTMKFYSITGKDDENALNFSGVCGFSSISNIHGSAEFSLYILPFQHRKGLGRAALKTLIRHGFETLNFHSIWGESFTGNPAMKLFDSLGFKREGVRRECYYKNGKYLDAHLFSILRSEWAP